MVHETYPDVEGLGGCGPRHRGDGVHHLVEEDAGFYAHHSGHDDLDPGGVAVVPPALHSGEVD